MPATDELFEHSEGNPQEAQRLTPVPPDALLDQAKVEAGRRSNAHSNKYGTARRSSPNGSAIGIPTAEGVFIENVSDDSDEALFVLYQAGNQAAFLRLYDRYKTGVYAYCARALFTVGLDSAHIDDTFQEVFLRIAQYQHTFAGGDFRAWLFTVVRHTCLITKKKSIRYRLSTEQVGDAENMDDEVGMEIRKALSITDDPLERMSQREQTDLLLKAIEELPESYREALLLSDYEGLTYEEIGKMTGTSLSTIRIRIFRAKARLRKVLLPILGDEVDKINALRMK